MLAMITQRLCNFTQLGVDEITFRIQVGLNSCKLLDVYGLLEIYVSFFTIYL